MRSLVSESFIPESWGGLQLIFKSSKHESEIL